MSDNEEGFAKDQAIEIIQFNYQPGSRAWTSLTKKILPFKKQNKLTLIACSSRFINQSIHSEWIESLPFNKKTRNIVFNAGGKTTEPYQEQNIMFSSEFESGNLEIVSRKKQNDYDLYMKPDTNTKNHFQWFYFKTFIKRARKCVKFTIKNFIKVTMLYSKGLKPYCRSLKNPDYHEFRQVEGAVRFYEDEDTGYYCLEFSHNFELDDDEVEFCSQPPYTFAHLSKTINMLKCKKLTLTKTVMGTKIPYLVFEAIKQPKVVAVVIARQHPGETVGSWMMEGFINKLSQNNYNDFISWYVIPMVNIDGVVLGNNRTGILGHDFNRNWEYDETSSSKINKLFPETQSIILLLKNLKRKFPRKVKMFLDLHGHSSQPNVFTYGPPHEEHSEYFYQCRLFPEIISKKNPSFKLSQCSYVLNPQKKQTARSIMFKNLGIPFTYTIESTFGIMNEKNSITDDFIQIGEDIAASAFEFLQTTVVKENVQCFSQLIEELKEKYATAKNEGEEYDSASDASDENPNRKKIQEMILAGQEGAKQEELRKRKGSQDYKANLGESPQRSKSLLKPNSFESKQYRNQSAKKSQKKRANTEGELLVHQNQDCMFPNIATRNSKLGFQQMSYLSNEEMMQNLKIDFIQKRLQKLRNSKIGKKILVINAYCS